MSKSLPLKVFTAVVGGNTNDAQVLKEIWHGVAYAREKEGRDWYALSRGKIHDATLLSLDKIERSLARLRSRGLITSEQHLFGGRNVNHYRLTESCQTLVAASREGNPLGVPMSSKPAVPESCKPAVPVSCISAALITSSTTAPTTALSTCEPVGSQGDPASGETGAEKEDKKEKNEEEKMDEKMNMKQQLELGKKKSSNLIHKPDTISLLAHVWKEKVAEKTGAMIVLNGKDHGQLKLFQKACPEGQAETILRRVLADWIGFTIKAKKAAGLKVTPAQPHVGFLLTHVKVAVMVATAMQSSADHHPKAQEASKVAPAPMKPPTPTSKFVPLHEEPVSYDELLKTSKGH